jgi:hypothetical protein
MFRFVSEALCDPARRGPTRATFRSQSASPPMRRLTRRRDYQCMAPEALIIDLSDRHSNDLDVVLLWARRSGRLRGTVTHRPSGRTARNTATPANALEVFRPPFAYDHAGASCP